METVRALALAVLEKQFGAEQYSNIALDTAIKRNPLSDADRGLLTALVYGVIERKLTLEHILKGLSDRPLEELDGRTHLLLLLGLYQLQYLDRVPDHAAVNETVSLASKRTRGFVNAILREHLRRGKRFSLPDPESDPIGYLSVNYSFGKEICARFLSAFGMERAKNLLDAFNRPSPLTLRVNTLRTSREELLSRLREAGYAAEPTRESEDGIRLPSAPVTSLPGFAQGEFFVQDEASQLCVKALDAQPGMTVLDTCACPGSKSFGIAIRMGNVGSVLSCDLHQNKLSLVESGAARLGISILTTEARDARAEKAEWTESFDRVLCDVPCSGFGVFAKKPELRYKDPKQSEALPGIQSAILQNASRFLKPGGLLVYSTCTLLPEENGENVAAFLRTHGEFTLLRERTLYPDTDGTDGFYYAVLQRH
jgi:16S rRNA (cytosine967-C5)-methyltransferase